MVELNNEISYLYSNLLTQSPNFITDTRDVSQYSEYVTNCTNCVRYNTGS